MYDFCFTIPYGAFLILGGVLGFLLKGSTQSLAAGTASGAVLAGLGYVSLGYYKQGKLCKPVTLLSLLMSTALTVIMYQRWQKTGAIFPALVFMITSGLMSVFYIWSLTRGPKPKPAEARA